MVTRPAGLPPMEMSKKTRGRALVSVSEAIVTVVVGCKGEGWLWKEATDRGGSTGGI